MNQHILTKPVLDPGALENEIRRRLQRGKARLLVAHLFFFILTVSVFLFVI
jgi:hypothetical protein